MRLFRKDIDKLEPYQPGKPIDEVKRELGLKKVIKVASNENPLGPSPLSLEAINKALGDINRYPDGSCFYLKKALAKNLRVKPSNLILGNGSDELIDIIIKAFLNEDEEALTSRNTFLEYEIVAKANARLVRAIPMKNFRYDLKAIKNAIRPKTKLVFIANPNNPTGTYVSQKEVGDFFKGLPKNIIVVFDEAYLEFVDKKDFPNTMALIIRENIIILRTFSKIYGLAGLRVGYGIARESFISGLERIRQPFNVNSLAQVAAAAAIEDKAFVKKTRSLILKEKMYLYQALDAIDVDYIPSAANFILIDLEKEGSVVFKNMLREGVIVRDMLPYGLKNYIRVTIGRRKENERFIEVLKKVLDRNQ
ncbi:MAG: histidinol-phosphate transaminase [Candidatus Omnitrophota bacterium]